MASEDPTELDAALYQSLLAHFLHMDNLVWSNIAMFIPVQSAVIVVGYFVRGTWAAFFVMTVGIVLIGLLLLFFEKTRRDRAVNIELMDEIGNRLVPNYSGLKTGARASKTNVSLIAYSQDVGAWGRVRVRYLYYTALALFLLIDLLLAIVYTSFPAWMSIPECGSGMTGHG